MKMKGISSVVAIILILMIVVSLAALAYVWFMTVFTSLTGAAGEAATGAEKAIGTSFKIEAAKNITPGPTATIKVSMRNIGTVDIDMSKIAVYLDGIQQDSANLEGDIGTLSVDDVRSFNITNVATPCDRVLQVTVPAGASDATTTVC